MNQMPLNSFAFKVKEVTQHNLPGFLVPAEDGLKI